MKNPSHGIPLYATLSGCRRVILFIPCSVRFCEFGLTANSENLVCQLTKPEGARYRKEMFEIHKGLIHACCHCRRGPVGR